MAEVLAGFYGWSRRAAARDLTRVRFFNAAGAEVLVLTTADTRLEWDPVSGNPIRLAATLPGGDADVTGKEFARIELYEGADTTHAAPVASEAFAAFTAAAGTTYVVELTLEIPDIP